MTVDFRGRHAIVTGGSSGIGKATARLLARQGAHLSLIARDPVRLEAARAEVEACRVDAGQRVLALSADVADRAQIEAAITAAIRQLGPPAVLIASAGVVQPGYFEELPMSAFERTMQVDYFGTLYAARAVLPAMRQQGHGHLVMLSSGAGLTGIFGYTAYSPAKFAVRGLAEALRAELKPMGVTLSVVFPPDTDTPQLAEENRIKPIETRVIAGKGGLWSADGVARAIVDGIRREAFRITPGIEMTLLAHLHSLFDPLLEAYMDWLVARVRRDRSRRAPEPRGVPDCASDKTAR